MLSQLVREIDAAQSAGAHHRGAVIIIGATNNPHAIDPALLRPGRLEHAIYVPPPQYSARRAILLQCLRKMPLRQDIPKWRLAAKLACSTEGFTGADLSSLCQHAAMSSMVDFSSLEQETSIEVCLEDFEQALRSLGPSVTQTTLQGFKSWVACRGEGSFTSVDIS